MLTKLQKNLFVLLAPLTINRHERPHKLPKFLFFKDHNAEYNSDERAIVVLIRRLATPNSNNFYFNKSPFSERKNEFFIRLIIDAFYIDFLAINSNRPSFDCPVSFGNRRH